MKNLIYLVRRSFDGDGDAGTGDAGSGDGEGTGDAGASGSGDGDAGTGDGDASSSSGDGTGADESGARITVLEAELKRARDEAASRRVALKEQGTEFDSFKKKLAEALGLGEDEGDEPDPAALSGEIDTLKGQNRALRLAAAFSKAARKVGADEDLSWAVAQSSNFVRGLDVDSDEDLGTSLAEYLEKAMKENPKLKAGPGAPPKSGTDFTGGTGTKTFTREELSRMTPEEIEENWEAISGQMKAGKVR